MTRTHWGALSEQSLMTGPLSDLIRLFFINKRVRPDRFYHTFTSF
jgi:hypothetical protein